MIFETPTTTAQEEYWTLSGKVARLTDDLTQAQDCLRAFHEEHPGQAFRAFRPSDILAAFLEHVEPWSVTIGPTARTGYCGPLGSGTHG